MDINNFFKLTYLPKTGNYKQIINRDITVNIRQISKYFSIKEI